MAVRDVGHRRRPLPWTLRHERPVSMPVPFAALTAIVDATALASAAALTTGADLLGVAFVLATFVALNAGWARARRIAPRFSDDAGWLLTRMSAPALIALTLGATGHWDPGALVPVSIGLVLVGRLVSYRLNRAARSRGVLQDRTVILGAGSIGSEIASILQDHPEYGLLPVGFVDSEAPILPLPLPLIGDVAELRETIRTYDIRRVIIAFGAAKERDLVRALRACDRLPVFVNYVPRFFELGGDRGVAADDLRSIPLVPLRRPGRQRTDRILKRISDVVGSTIGLILAAPILAAAALAVRLTSPGPVIFRQERIGRDGETFSILKFRTMRVNGHPDTAWGTRSDRVTRVGRILRKTSIDELPQLMNVLRGEMSLVGPRPEQPHFVDEFQTSIPGYGDRHRVAGGITGWAQIHGLRGGERSSIPERARFDNYYIERWSAWRDLVVIARTFKSVVTGDGEA